MGASAPAFLAVLLSIVCGSSCNQPFTAEMIAEGVVSGSNIGFTTDLYKAVSSEVGNLVISPIGAQAILTMAWLGANGTTASQLETGVSIIPESRYHTILGFKILKETFKTTPTMTVDFATKLYLQKDFQVSDTFQEAMREAFQSEVEQVDFTNQLEAARTTINQWVEQQTHEKIKDAIPEGALSESALLVAVNALYFKGGWVKPFDVQRTTTEPFHVSATTTVDVPMMHQKEYFMYTQIPEAGCQAILMKYRGANDDPTGDDQNTGMLILLPDERDGLANLEAYLNSGNFSTIPNILREMYYREVDVSLPRFKIEKSLKLNSALNKLGITDLFQPGADLSGITHENIYVSKVMQKTVIEVTEKGTEAAAVTIMEAIPMAAFIPPVFKADHPFMFVVVREPLHLNLFMGRVVNPS